MKALLISFFVLCGLAVFLLVDQFTGNKICLDCEAPDAERNYYNGYVDGKLDCEREYGFPPPAHGL